MATVTNWIDHLSASEIAGAVYPGVGTEGILVLIAFVVWIGWTVIYHLNKKVINFLHLLGKNLVQMLGRIM